MMVLNTKFHFLLILTFLSSILFSQDSKFEVTYSVYSNWKTKDTKNEQYKEALLKAMSQKKYYQLRVDNEQSHYQYVPKIDNDNSESIKISLSSINSFIYTDTKKDLYITEAVWPKKIIIKDTIEKYDWKIFKENKTLLGFKVYKAFLKLDEFIITAWYTPEINVKAGPDEYSGLPGLILFIETKHQLNDEIKIYEAVDINVLSGDFKLSPPEIKTKPMTRVEFKTFFDDFVKKENAVLGVDKD